MVSGYLLRRLRSLAEAKADIERARRMWSKPIEAIEQDEAAVADSGVSTKGTFGDQAEGKEDT